MKNRLSDIYAQENKLKTPSRSTWKRGFLKKSYEAKVIKNKESPTITLEKIKQALSEIHACYVLITCSEPSKEGKMEVEMSYEGDESLASFLVDNASQVFDERLSRRESK